MPSITWSCPSVPAKSQRTYLSRGNAATEKNFGTVESWPIPGTMVPLKKLRVGVKKARVCGIAAVALAGAALDNEASLRPSAVSGQGSSLPRHDKSRGGV